MIYSKLPKTINQAKYRETCSESGWWCVMLLLLLLSSAYGIGKGKRARIEAKPP